MDCKEYIYLSSAIRLNKAELIYIKIQILSLSFEQKLLMRFMFIFFLRALYYWLNLLCWLVTQDTLTTEVKVSRQLGFWTGLFLQGCIKEMWHLMKYKRENRK